MNHPVKLSEDEKRKWFVEQINQRRQVDAFESLEELEKFLRNLAKAFKLVYGREVSGAFLKNLLEEYGIECFESEAIKKKKEFIFKLLDENQAYRDSKSQLRKAVTKQFGESILSAVFDRILKEYEMKGKPLPKKNIDIFGQGSLFE